MACSPFRYKGFQALQAHRVAHVMWKSGKTVLAHYLQSAVSNQMQIDIHPNATLGAGIMLDHGTGKSLGKCFDHLVAFCAPGLFITLFVTFMVPQGL